MAATKSGMSKRVVYASEIGGVRLDLDPATRAKVGGGTPTDNAAALNRVLARASATTPVHLIIDGGCAIGAPLVVVDPDHTVIGGIGMTASTLFLLGGSNCQAIQDVPDTDKAIWDVWNPASLPTVRWKGFRVHDLKIDCNRGNPSSTNTLTSGMNSTGNAGRDGTVTDAASLASVGDARGPYTVGYWLSGIMLTGIDGPTFENVWVYDAPAYHINLYHCPRARFLNCRIEAGNPSFLGNTDGIHLNGACVNPVVSGCWLSTGDDGVAVNCDEGYGADTSDVFIADSTFVNSATIARIYGNAAHTRRVMIHHCTATGISYHGVTIGLGGQATGPHPDDNHSVWIDGLDFTPGGCTSIVWLANSSGHIHLRDVWMHDPTAAIPMVLLDGNCRVSALTVAGCGIHRSAYGSAAAYALRGGDFGGGCQIGVLSVRDFQVTEQLGQSYADIPALIDLTGTTILGPTTVSGVLAGVGTVVNVPSGAACGPVVLNDLVHVSHGGSARTVVNDSATAFKLHGNVLGTGVAALTGGSGTIDSTGASLVAL